MFQVVKRDGEVDEFKIGKITAAIHKAFDAKEKNYSEEMIDLLGLRVTSDFQKKITDNKITVEEIQDSVENVLIQAGYADVAKAYILYRKQREKVRNMKSTILDYKEIVNSYVKVEDWHLVRLVLRQQLLTAEAVKEFVILVQVTKCIIIVKE